MKVKVDKELCISCGLCMNLCPEVFEYDSENKSKAKTEEVAPEFQEKVEESVEICPVEAIITE